MMGLSREIYFDNRPLSERMSNECRRPAFAGLSYRGRAQNSNRFLCVKRYCNLVTNKDIVSLNDFRIFSSEGFSVYLDIDILPHLRASRLRRGIPKTGAT